MNGFRAELYTQRIKQDLREHPLAIFYADDAMKQLRKVEDYSAIGISLSMIMLSGLNGLKRMEKDQTLATDLASASNPSKNLSQE